MGVLEKLRIGPESEEESGSEFDPESGTEFEPEYDYESSPHLDPPPGTPVAREKEPTRTKLAQVRDAAPRVTKKMRDDAEAEVRSIVEIIALAWGWQAPPCGDALEAAAPKFAEKLTKILARNPRWLQKVRDGGLIADIIACAGTLGPVARVAYEHYSQPREGGAYRGPGVEFDPNQFQPYDGSGFSRAG